MRSKLAEDLKNVLDNMSQEQFDKEWEEDAEIVVPAMLRAVTLFFEDKELLLETLDYDIDNFNYI